MPEGKLKKGTPSRHKLGISITDQTGTYRADAVRNVVEDAISKYLLDTGRADDFSELEVNTTKS